MAAEIEQAKKDAMAVMVDGTGFSMQGLAEVFVQSGFFKDVKASSQAVVKILYGQELGLTPIQAMLGIYMVEGRPEIAATMMGALLRKSGKYTYRVTEHTSEVCAIEFFEVGKDGTKESIGMSRWDEEDTLTAGLNRGTHLKYPKAMKFARAMSQGVRWYCLDAMGSVPVYAEGEVPETEPRAVGASSTADAEVDEFTPSKKATTGDAPASKPDAGDSEGPGTGQVGEQSGQAPAGAPVNPPQGADAPPPAPKPVARAPKATKVTPPAPEPTREAPPAEPPPQAPAMPLDPSPANDPDAPKESPEIGSEDCPILGEEGRQCWAGRGHAGSCVYAPDVESPAPAVSAPAVRAPITFKFMGRDVKTMGMTLAQLEESVLLATAVDKAKAAQGVKQFSKILMGQILNKPPHESSRTEFDAEQGARLIAMLKAEAPPLGKVGG